MRRPALLGTRLPRRAVRETDLSKRASSLAATETFVRVLSEEESTAMAEGLAADASRRQLVAWRGGAGHAKKSRLVAAASPLLGVLQKLVVAVSGGRAVPTEYPTAVSMGKLGGVFAVLCRLRRTRGCTCLQPLTEAEFRDFKRRDGPPAHVAYLSEQTLQVCEVSDYQLPLPEQQAVSCVDYEAAKTAEKLLQSLVVHAGGVLELPDPLPDGELVISRNSEDTGWSLRVE